MQGASSSKASKEAKSLPQEDSKTPFVEKSSSILCMLHCRELQENTCGTTPYQIQGRAWEYNYNEVSETIQTPKRVIFTRWWHKWSTSPFLAHNFDVITMFPPKRLDSRT
ncbi:hypothetical protein ACOSQ3_004368 [Xanthoceras sorbifolium]